MIIEKLKEVQGIDKYGEKLPDWTEELKYEFVDEIMGDKLREAEEWINQLYKILEELREKLKIRGWLFSREMKSFLDDPKRHLVKKLFLYFHDLARGRIDANEFVSKGSQAIKSSFGSNMRSIYQSWGLAAILVELSERGYRLVYPEHGYLDFDRSGKQKSGIIPPNAVVEDLFGNSLSFFMEAPRPISWEDGTDLERVWKLYSLVRPDMLIYKGFVMNIVELENQEIPIKRPNYVVEFKELDNWWKRWRYLKGYKPLSGNEWRARWLKGLYEGLADILGVKPSDLPQFEESKGKRIREYKVIELYKAIYKPDKGVVISRVPVDDNVKADLGEGIIFTDGVYFYREKLSEVIDDLTKNMSRNVDIKDLAYKFAIENKTLFLEWLKSKGITIQGGL